MFRSQASRALCSKVGLALIGLVCAGVLASEASAKGPAGRYKYKAGDATVVDGYTGLQWQRHFVPKAMTYATAVNHCAKLSLDKHNDWRLPTIRELLSIVDHTENTKVDPEAFPNVTKHFHWTSTPSDAAKKFRHCFYFVEALIIAKSVDEQNILLRCVRKPK